MRCAIITLVVCASILCFAPIARAYEGVNEVPMVDADDFVVTAETNKDEYVPGEKIRIYAKIINNKRDQIIIWGLKCEVIISQIGTGIYWQKKVDLTRYEDWQAIAGRNSTKHKWIIDFPFDGVWYGSTRRVLDPGQYWVSISFIDPQYSNMHICGGSKIINVKNVKKIR